MKPFGFHDYNKLQMSCFCAISDSGTIVEESSILGFPAITPRDAIERPEGMDVGCIIQTGLDCDSILAAIDAMVAQHTRYRKNSTLVPSPVDYQITNTAERVLNLILGTAKLSNSWDGIRLNDFADS